MDLGVDYLSRAKYYVKGNREINWGKKGKE
jgi:hypothetical protein